MGRRSELVSILDLHYLCHRKAKTGGSRPTPANARQQPACRVALEVRQGNLYRQPALIPARRLENRLLRQRAVENRAYILAVNCADTDLAGLTYAGHSGLLVPHGEWLGKCEPYREEILMLDF